MVPTRLQHDKFKASLTTPFPIREPSKQHSPSIGSGTTYGVPSTGRALEQVLKDTNAGDAPWKSGRTTCESAGLQSRGRSGSTVTRDAAEGQDRGHGKAQERLLARIRGKGKSGAASEKRMLKTD